MSFYLLGSLLFNKIMLFFVRLILLILFVLLLLSYVTNFLSWFVFLLIHLASLLFHCIFIRLFDLIPINRKLNLLLLFIFLFLLMNLILLNILWFVFIFFFLWLLLASNDLAPLHSESHVVGTEGRSTFAQVKGHVLTSVVVEVETSFDLESVESTVFWKIGVDGKIMNTSLQFFFEEESRCKDIHMVEIVQKIYLK